MISLNFEFKAEDNGVLKTLLDNNAWVDSRNYKGNAALHFGMELEF